MARTGQQADPQTTPESPGDFTNAHAFWSRLAAARFSPTIGVALVLMSGMVLLWATMGDEGPTSQEQLAEAFRLLDEGDGVASRQAAREIARRLEALGYHDPDFAGGVEYVLGIIAFRNAAGKDEVGKEQQYVIAARYLHQAERLALSESRRPEWTYALGTSLHEIGSATEARPLLEEAVESYAPGRIDASMRLTDIYLDLKTPDDLARALALSEAVLDSPETSPLERDRVHLQRAQVFLALDRSRDATLEIEQVSQAASKNQGTKVFRAQTLMAEEKHQEALQELKPVAEDVGLERTFPRQALYLMGVCAETLAGEQAARDGKQAAAYREAAINYYERTAQRYAKSHEGLAANLRAADLLREDGSHELALKYYRRALETVRQPEDFRNRWLGLDEFRHTILNAWNEWSRQHAYQWAIELSKLMHPLIPAVQAHELAARANQRWAEHLDGELQEAPFSERPEREQELRMRWRSSGKSFADLALTMTTSPDYPEALWTSAEHYRRGHDFENALAQLTRFLNTRPKELMPLALVRRGELLMDLDRLDEALEHFRRVAAVYPTDSAAFEAEYLIGRCLFEHGELKAAERAWREILTSSSLTPAANEWRLALFSLGRLLYHRAFLLMKQAEKERSTDVLSRSDLDVAKDASAHWEESVRRLEEFLKRYPDAFEAVEARSLLAKALQHSAESPRQKLRAAETENARLELRRTMHALLRQAIREFRQLQLQLLAKEQTDRLDPLGKRILRDCYFEIAHTYFLLEQYTEAVVSYGIAANKYPQDPQILLAYIQMANCYARLGKPTEARSNVEQGKLILKQLSKDVFQPSGTNFSREEWANWLDWTGKLHQISEPATLAGPGRERTVR